jgi:hypothetical protein
MAATHAATHATAHAAAMATATTATTDAAATAAARKRRWRQRECRTNRTGHEAFKKPVAHFAVPPWLNGCDGYRRSKAIRRTNGPDDFK